jgi:hypothetical protein
MLNENPTFERVFLPTAQVKKMGIHPGRYRGIPAFRLMALQVNITVHRGILQMNFI